MLPLQEIKIKTKKGREFAVHLEKYSEAHFESKMAAINLGPELAANAIFGPFSKGETADEAFRSLVQGIKKSLYDLDNTDSISVIENPCNTELIDKSEQENISGSSVLVMVNRKQ